MALDKDEKTLRDIVVGYAYEPAFFMNYAVLLTWLPVRFFLLKDLGSLPTTDYLGLTRVRCLSFLTHNSTIRANFVLCCL